MATRFVAWQASVLDAAGNVKAAVTVEVRDADSGDLVTLYSDRLGESPITPPLLTDDNGFVRFYVPEGRYDITATKSPFVARTWLDVQLIGDMHDEQVLDGATVTAPSGTQNDYILPAGIEVVVLDTTAGAVTFTGFASDALDEVIKRIVNAGPNDITVNHDNAGSIASNRVLLPGAIDFIVPQYAAVSFWKDPTIDRWRIV